MTERRFEVTLPDELVSNIGWEQAEVPQRLREMLVMELLRIDRLSEAEAAELLQLDRWELLDTMGRYQVPAIRMDESEMLREMRRGTRQEPA